MSIININVGILGHVDCGKTSLSKALSTVASTAAFDKNPESQQRGITLDLGFSSFIVENTPGFTTTSGDIVDALQITLVDCPGHASLIRTIICGSHIIDFMLLVVDINKGFQTQTSECLIIGELTCENMIVVLNKIDRIKTDKRKEKIGKVTMHIKKLLEDTKFRDCEIVAVSANPDEGEVRNEASDSRNDMTNLIISLVKSISNPVCKRSHQALLPFLFAVDHCFPISGHGTIFTGTVLNGTVSIGDTVELPHLGIQKKVKSMQIFRKPTEKVGPGDRVGISVLKVDSRLVERGYLSKPGSLVSCHACILADVKRISYFRLAIRSKSKFHVSLGQVTIVARILCFRSRDQLKATSSLEEAEFEYIEELEANTSETGRIIMLLEFENVVTVPLHSLVIGSRLDTKPMERTCRLAFHGSVSRIFIPSDYKLTILPTFNAYRMKSRHGTVERVLDSNHCIVRGLFTRDSKLELFQNLKVAIYSAPDQPTCLNYSGFIERPFGQSGKCVVRMSDHLPDEIVKSLHGKASKKILNDSKISSEQNPPTLAVTLFYKKYVYNAQKRFVQ